MSSSSMSRLKRANQQQVTRYFYEHGSATKQELEATLGLSLPTITQHLHELENSGIIAMTGLNDSTGGRRAQRYAFASRARIAIGASIRRHQVTCCAVDLHGSTIASSTQGIALNASDPSYYQEIDAVISNFAHGIQSNEHQLLGVAFAIQGLVSADGQRITFGNIMGDTGVTIEQLAGDIGYPSTMIHDSDASAMAELWFDRTINDATILYLERRIGGAVIMGGALYRGRGLTSGTVEHMTLVPHGRLCYCGHRGCVDPYCSPETLMHRGESMEHAFATIHQAQHHRDRTDYVSRLREFNRWLDHIASTITNMRMVIASDVILGGEASRFLNENDMQILKHNVLAHSPFADSFTLKRSLCIPNQGIVGAALRLISPYVKTLCGEAHG
ncbi:ROK family protein [Bifidobacterium aquikefiri]|uniref:ROK family transcriptional regulator n=1 Tax=Bifidobacterium aquikefiri TaxID=1653207 RepID=UPI0039E781C3